MESGGGGTATVGGRVTFGSGVSGSSGAASGVGVPASGAGGERVVAALRVVSRQSEFFEAVVDIEVRDLGHLSRIIAGLRGAGVVHQVERARG